MQQDLQSAAQAWLADGRGRRRMTALRAVCDTFVPAVRPPANVPGLGGFWVRTASDIGVDLAVAGWIQTLLPAADRDGLMRLLDLLAATRFDRLPQAAREAVIRSSRASADLARGFDGLRALTLGLFYGLPDPTGHNVNWNVLGYPGPPDIAPPPDRPRITPWVPEGSDPCTLNADVVVVGSGSGGGVIAGVLAQAGLDVVVLEAGGHYEEHNFPPHELEALRALYWRGGFTPSADGNISIAAGATLGGGSTVNWTNCVLPPDRLRREWAEEHGLKDVDSPAFDAHLSAVTERISATPDCSDDNGPNSRMVQGAEALAWSHKRVLRNADTACYDPATAGHMGYGDRSGSRQGTLNTYLLDAVAHGARVLVRCGARRVLTRGGKASGVEAVLADGDQELAVTVKADTVVMACGALETPALLLRSGIGGPAVGRNLHLHPATGMIGIFPQEQRSWWGPPHSAIVDEFADIEDGYGFLIEGVHYGTAFAGGTMPWHRGRDHKVLMSRSANSSVLLTLLRDRGSGRVAVDDKGDAVVTHPLDDPLDQANMRKSVAALARLMETAGAGAILDTVNTRRVMWRRGEPLDRFLLDSAAVPLRLPHRVVATAHQMGSARMGQDPQTSVADPEGQLHDTPGVWIGDTSAFPTASGVNPMLTCMALARRTAHAILAATPGEAQ